MSDNKPEPVRDDVYFEELSRAVEAGEYTVAGPVEYGPRRDESLAQALSEADELYAAEQSGERRPALDESTVTTPNFAKSKVVHVRLNEQDYGALAALAGDRQVHISDVVRAAIAQYLRSGSR